MKPCTVTECNQFGSHSQILCISFIRSGHQRADRQVRPKDLWTQLKLYHKEIKFMWFTFQKVTFGGLYLLLFCNLMQTMWTFETLLTVKPAQITQNQSSNKEWIKTDCDYSQIFFLLKKYKWVIYLKTTIYIVILSSAFTSTIAILLSFKLNVWFKKQS